MAKERELTERVERVEEIIKQLESGDPSREEGKRLFEDIGHRFSRWRLVPDDDLIQVVVVPPAGALVDRPEFLGEDLGQ